MDNAEIARNLQDIIWSVSKEAIDLCKLWLSIISITVGLLNLNLAYV